MKSDIEIAQASQGLPVTKIAKKLKLSEQDLELFGLDKVKINWSAIKQAQINQHLGKLVLVTSTSPTPAGEDEPTTTIGLVDVLNNQLHGKTLITLHEPSMGSVFGLKGGATGGRRAQVIPMEDTNLHFTGDAHALTSAAGTLATLVDSYIY